jgi:uncharacterized protein YpmB
MNMSTVKIWLTTILLILLLALAALVVGLWNNISSEWQVEETTAQYALNHSPLASITSHRTFTGAGEQEVFYGHDTFNRPWYTFVFGQPLTVQSVPGSDVISEQQVEGLAEKSGIKPIHCELGYVPTNTRATLPAKRHVVWEVYGENRSGHLLYVYYDATTGKQLWQYVLST